MRPQRPHRLDVRIVAEAVDEPRERVWLYSFEPAGPDATLSVTTVPEFADITKPTDMFRRFKPAGAFQQFTLEACHWKGAGESPEWKEDPPPVAEQVKVSATLRNDEPVLQMLLIDIAGDFRGVQLTEDAVHDALDGIARFIGTLHRGDRRLR